jgi:hypothetical protein
MIGISVLAFSSCQKSTEHDWFLATYPIPTQQRFAVTYSGNIPSQANLQFINSNGSVVSEQIVQASPNFRTIPFEIDQLGSSSYTVVLSSEGEVLESITIVKVNP